MVRVDEKISKYFSWHEILWLPQWQIHYLPTPTECTNVINFAQSMDKVRDLLGKPLIVHIWFRPPVYNALVNGAKGSPHLQGRAVDFHVQGLDVDSALKIIEPKLEQLGLRAENNYGKGWIHLDNFPVINKRLFNP